MAGDIDANLLHYRDRFRTNTARLGARAGHFEEVAGIVAQQPLSHLAARRVARAQDENGLLHPAASPVVLNKVFDVPSDLVADPPGRGVQAETGMLRVFQIPAQPVDGPWTNRARRFFLAIAKLDEIRESLA